MASTSFLNQREAMQGPNTNTSTSTKSFKQAFLKNLLLSLQVCTSTRTSFNAMSLHERKRAVKFSADVAMAAARGAAGGGGARWPKAILAAATSSSSNACKVQRCKRIVRRCCHKRRCCTTGSSTSGDIARTLVRRRTMALRKVIPGGDAMDEVSLLHEAMDYVVHLRAQVDVLRRISKAVQRSSVLRNSWSQCALKEKEDSRMRE